MAANSKPSDGKLLFIKFARALTYLVYAYCIVASIFLALGTFLLLFSANTTTGFVKFVYSMAENFLQPFVGIFPPHPVSQTGYFSTSAAFAIIVYLLVALGIHGLINWITAKMVVHETELAHAQAVARQQKLASSQAAFRATGTVKPPRRQV